MTPSGPDGGNLHSHSGVLNSGQQDPGLHSTNQDPGPSSHPPRHVSARPVFYVHAPPPPPFLHYQWPMPLFYNPFDGFPGMGYGVVMPPFPPPLYMETPTYVVPHPHIQPVDHRRLHHPQVYAPSAPFQNPNQTRRVRPPQTVPVRETVNSEVQTEPAPSSGGDYGDGSPLVRSDSGRGTASNSPSSSSSSQKPDSEVDNFENLSHQVRTLATSSARDFQVNGTYTSSTVKHGFNILHPTGTKMVQSSIRATLEAQKYKDSVAQENCRNSHCNVWSVSSSDSVVPVCSSSQREDEVVKGRPASTSDIQVSCGSATPQATVLKITDQALPHNDHQLMSPETQLPHEKSLYQSPVSDPVVADHTEDIMHSKDSESLFKILKLPLAVHEHPSESSSESREDDTHLPNQMSLNWCQIKKKMNESVWSVESLPPFIPTKDWLMQNGMFEPEVIVEMVEDAENCRLSTQNDNLIVNSSKERSQTGMPDSWLNFCLAEKRSPPNKPELAGEIDATEMNKGQIMTPSGKDPIAFPDCLQNEIDENGSSEPEAQSPNQECHVVYEKQEKSSCFPEKEATVLASETVEKLDFESKDGACGQLCAPVVDPKMVEVSPSKGHLVDCGIQCNKLEELKCLCEEMKSSMGPNRRHLFKLSEMKVNGVTTEGFCMNTHMHKNQKRSGQWRNRASEKNSQQEAYNGHAGKPGKSKGGNGRNHRY